MYTPVNPIEHQRQVRVHQRLQSHVATPNGGSGPVTSKATQEIHGAICCRTLPV